MPGDRIDGTDVLAVHEEARTAIERARSGAGPTLLEIRAYRWKEHVGPNFDYNLGYRTKEELESWMARCPIRLFRERVTREGVCTQEELDQIGSRLNEEIAEAVRFGKESPEPTAAELASDVY